jgi:hypothetical protein
LKRAFKILLKTILSLLGLILLYGLAALVLPLISVNSKTEQPEEITIYILSNGVHTDIVCPIESEIINWTEIAAFENTVSKRTDFKHVAFGWGDKGFYLETPTWADLKEGEDCKKIIISKENYRLLVEYIKKSFDYENGKTMFIPTDMVYGKNDAFYDAQRSYNLFFTCNTWANSALKHANQKAAFWTATDKGIFRQYK